MSKREPLDEVQEAARLMRAATDARETPLPADAEKAWAEWSSAIKRVDTRTMGLLRAAFEAGLEVGAKSAAAATGRTGGLKGGKARAKALTKEQRSTIAKKAAETRWRKQD